MENNMTKQSTISEDSIEYNYPRFKAAFYQFEDFKGLEIGEQFIDFELKTIDGELKKISDFLDKPIVLEMGSITCPMYAGNSSPMNKLAEEYTDFNFLVLYVREAHPGNKTTYHHTQYEKFNTAQRVKNVYNEHRTVLVDTINGDAHKVYGALPNSIYIIDTSGKIIFCKAWNNYVYFKNIIKAVGKNKNLHLLKFRPAKPGLIKSYITLITGGIVSLFDFIFQLPMLLWKHLKAGNLF